MWLEEIAENKGNLMLSIMGKALAVSVIANRYEICMSIMGKKAISLDELAKIMEEHAE